MQYKWVALSVTTVGVLMSSIDSRIVIVGLPTIARQLNTGVVEIIWVTQAYLLASTVGLLLIGRVTDLIGRVKLYNYGFIIFTIGSAFAAFSFTPLELIAARAVQGIGSSMLTTNSAAILADATPKKELGTILGLNQIAFRVGSVFGLTASGFILAFTDWRALFYINLPIGIFGTLWAHLRLKEIYTKDEARKMDWSGFVSFTSGLTMILLAITFLSYGLSEAVLGALLLTLGSALILVFARIETRKDAPLLDLRLLKIKEFVGGNISQFLNGLAWSGSQIMISFYLQIALGYTPLRAGLSLLPLDAAYLISGPLSGKFSDKYGQRLFTTVGLAVTTLGFAMLGMAATTLDYSKVVAALLVLGVGNGMFVSPNQSSVMGSVPANRRGIAAGFYRTLFQAGTTSSAGVITLLITFTIPYAQFTSLVQGTLSQAASQAAVVEFVNGFKFTSLVLAAINAIAIIPSFLRGGRVPVPSSTLETQSSIEGES